MQEKGKQAQIAMADLRQLDADIRQRIADIRKYSDDESSVCMAADEIEFFLDRSPVFDMLYAPCKR